MSTLIDAPLDTDTLANEGETDARTALEYRANTLSLDELHAKRRLLMERNARLFALYGAFGHYDDHRKRMVEALKVKARMELSQGRDKKPTEAEIDANAYGSEQYGRFIDTALDEKIEYLKLATEIGEVEELIRSREIELRAYAAETILR
jgi:hypothetical protein